MAAHDTFRATPLGGLGHVGGNMMVYETVEDLIVVDCGVLFPTAEQPGVNYIIPDMTYVLQRRHKLRGFVLTHGHEDHIGALPFVLPTIHAPIYGTRLTLELLASKLAEHPSLDATLREIRDRETFELGQFSIEPLAVTHSIPDAVALAIHTPVGVVVHTGDFKIDAHPLDDRLTDSAAFRALGDQGVVALFSDSTNAEREGQTWSEKEIGENLARLIGDARGRVVVTAFASNLHRLQSIIDASDRVGRRVYPVGRSMQQNVHMALERGYLRTRFGVLGEIARLGHRHPSEVTIVASGSQGEPLSAMARISRAQHAQVRVEPGDLVIMSSRRIPGNERAVGRMINDLYRLGAEVVDDRAARVHASGHAFRDEQRQMIEWCRPRFFLPIHGEYRHLVRHAQLARDTGVLPTNIAVVEDGQPVQLERGAGGVRMRRLEPVACRQQYVDGKGIGDIDDDVLRDRRMLADTGLVICVVVLDGDGRWARGPDIITRGLIRDEAHQDLIDRAMAEVRAFAANEALTPSVHSEQIRQVLRRFFRRELGRRPLVLTVALSINS